MPVRTKRWNDPPEPDDGYRLLICRYRPRGVKKSDEARLWDAWCPALAPSVELHSDAYGKNEQNERIAFDEYEARFRSEMTRQRFWLEGFASRVRDGESITLLCSSACTDPSRCHRTLVKQMIDAIAFPEARPSAAARGVVRRRSS